MQSIVEEEKSGEMSEVTHEANDASESHWNIEAAESRLSFILSMCLPTNGNEI